MIGYFIQILTAGIASFGFAVLYNGKGKRLIIPFIGGILSWALYLMLMFLNNEILQCLFTTIFLTLYTEIAARIIKTPTTTFLVKGKETLFIAAAIAAGIMIVSSTIKIIYKIKEIAF